MKKINNRNIISVSDDMLNSAETFVFFFSAIIEANYLFYSLSCDNSSTF
jgi:hypothetical protein